MFQVGGTDIYLHKYLGSNTAQENATADKPHYANVSPTNIQDLLFLENRDRKYDKEIYRIRGFYNVQNIDFNLSQFGLFIDNDTLYMSVHINDYINYVGRKPISGDVLELPHLKDDFALNDFDVSLPRYYVIEDVGRASEGFSATWYPHIYRLRVTKITDNQQFSDILDLPAGENTTLTVRYLTGGGVTANVGANTLTRLNATPLFLKSNLSAVTANDIFSSISQPICWKLMPCQWIWQHHRKGPNFYL